MRQVAAVPGLRLRPFAGGPDLAAIARIENAAAEADRVPERTSLEDLAVVYDRPNEHFDPARDVTMAEIDGSPVAFGSREWVETTDGFREYRLNGSVEPAWRRRGIGTALLGDSLRRSRELAATHETTLPRIFGSWCTETEVGATALLERAGFVPARYFFDMERPSLDDIPAVPLPDGLVLRPITRDNALAAWRGDVEAFRDHWGGFDGSDERLERWLERPSTDLSLWVVAFDGDEVAGGVFNNIDAEENASLGVRRGLLASVFTRRPWRRRGLARALIAESLARLRDRGMDTAILGVDAENASGALGLYERLGFEVSFRSTAWRKPFEEVDA